MGGGRCRGRLSIAPDDSWTGRWASVVGLIDPPRLEQGFWSSRTRVGIGTANPHEIGIDPRSRRARFRLARGERAAASAAPPGVRQRSAGGNRHLVSRLLSRRPLARARTAQRRRRAPPLPRRPAGRRPQQSGNPRYAARRREARAGSRRTSAATVGCTGFDAAVGDLRSAAASSRRAAARLTGTAPGASSGDAEIGFVRDPSAQPSTATAAARAFNAGIDALAARPALPRHRKLKPARLEPAGRRGPRPRSQPIPRPGTARSRARYCRGRRANIQCAPIRASAG